MNMVLRVAVISYFSVFSGLEILHQCFDTRDLVENSVVTGSERRFTVIEFISFFNGIQYLLGYLVVLIWVVLQVRWALGGVNGGRS